MSTETTTKKMTAEEFYEWSNLPENENKWHELVREEVVELPAPTKPHGVVSGNIVWVLNGFVRQRGKGYVTSNDSGVILERDPDTVRGPDVAVYEDARAFDELHPKYGEVPPVWPSKSYPPATVRTASPARSPTTFGAALRWFG